MTKKRWLSIDQVRELIPVSRATIMRYVNDPTYAHLGFPKPFMLGFRVMFEETVLLEWMDAHPKH